MVVTTESFFTQDFSAVQSHIATCKYQTIARSHLQSSSRWYLLYFRDSVRTAIAEER
ncbi:MAG TPA: hypothetical protein VIQ31_26500 [Phormidium sp.]